MTHNVNVMVRLRPLLRFENQPAWMAKESLLIALHSHSRAIKLSSNEGTSSGKEAKEIQHEFAFESIVGQSQTSQQLYKKWIRPTLLECCQDHRNMSIMAYGQTCSGKTHTILGIKEAPGVIPCVLRQLFRLGGDKNCRLKVSYLQIYNQKLRDLLDKKSNDKQIKIVEDSKWGCEVSGTTKQPIKSFEEAIKILEKGEKERQYGQGEHHQRSSRSHTLFRIFIEQWDSNFCSKSFAITLVDLAGSERLVSSSQSPSETGFINKSLFQLANVISKLAQQSQHIPYRDSKLTRILEPTLSGSGRTMLICCVSPSMNCYGETLSTLRLAERAKKIKLPDAPLQTQNETLQALKELVRQKSRECSDLKKQIQLLNNKLADQQQQISNLKATTSSKPVQKCSMVILFDHQNFSLFLGDSYRETQLSSSMTAAIKEEFISNMQLLYERYTEQILELCTGDGFQLKIEEICFMNLVLEHQKISEYKVTVIDEILKERGENSGQENQQFYRALEKYREKMWMDIQSSKVSTGFLEKQQRSYRKGMESSYRHQMEEVCQQMNGKKIELDSNIAEAQPSSEMVVWGSKKDYRVCKGQQYQLNMVRITNIKNIVSVACGYHHTLVVTAEGKVYGWGKNTERQISPSSKDSISSPFEIEGVYNVKTAAAGWGHSLVLTQQGEVFSWGYGNDGQLGHGNKEDVSSPTQIDHQYQIVSIYAGHSHSAFIDIHRDLYSFGFNQDYRSLIGDQKILLQPKRVPIRDVREAALGLSHSVIITLNGSVYCGGVGTSGELGVVLDASQPGWERLEVTDRQFEAQSFEKICPLVQVQVFNSKNKAYRAYCGQSSTFILTQKQELWSFGKSSSGRIGHKKLFPSVILQSIDMLNVGSRHGFAYSKKQNKLYSWGFNLYGQANSSVSGDIQTPELIQQFPQKEILGIACGFFHSVLLLK